MARISEVAITPMISLYSMSQLPVDATAIHQIEIRMTARQSWARGMVR